MNMTWPGFDEYLYFLTLIEWFGYVIFGLIGLVVLINVASSNSEKP